jgi:hypothetical protein
VTARCTAWVHRHGQHPGGFCGKHARYHVEPRHGSSYDVCGVHVRRIDSDPYFTIRDIPVKRVDAPRDL